MGDYKATVQSARGAIPETVQIEKLFPNVDHFITHYGMSGPKVWNSEAFIGGAAI